ncbi:hypothetical protein EC845_1998 [Comamonas sp. BIGb0124]|nr:hypothetical protein EC845_1998 [Comamonas sp. BIGb0124]
MSVTNSYITEQSYRFAKVSWGAIFAGLVIGLIVYLVLSVLGTAIGASAIDPLASGNPFDGFGAGASIWAGVTTLISIALGGFVAGYLARRSGALHGLLSWAVTTLFAGYLLLSATGTALNMAGSAAKAGLSAAGTVVTAGAAAAGPALQQGIQNAGVSFDTRGLQDELETLLRQTGKPELQPEQLKSEASGTAAEGQARVEQSAQTPQAAGADGKAWFEGVMARADRVLNAADKDALINIIVARTGKSRAEAQQIADNYERAYNEARAKFEQAKQDAEQKAREAGAKAAAAIAKGSWATLAVLILGALISAGAGAAGYRRQPREVRAPIVTERP